MNQSTLLHGLVALVTLTFAGCTSVEVANFDGQRRPPTTNVEIFPDRSNIKRSYREIGMIVVDDGESGAWGLGGEPRLIQRALVRARTMGANGIILLPTELQQRNFGYGGAYNSATRRILRASAFIYTDRTPTR